MTIKVYKRQNNWFFTHKGDECQLTDGAEVFVDCLGLLLKKDIVYFEIGYSDAVFSLYLWDIYPDRVEFRLTGDFIFLVFKLFQKQGLKRTVTLPRKWFPDDVPTFLTFKIK